MNGFQEIENLYCIFTNTLRAVIFYVIEVHFFIHTECPVDHENLILAISLEIMQLIAFVCIFFLFLNTHSSHDLEQLIIHNWTHFNVSSKRLKNYFVFQYL